jgi:hypothetical protein
MIMMPYGRRWSSLQLTGHADFWHPAGTWSILRAGPHAGITLTAKATTATIVKIHSGR